MPAARTARDRRSKARLRPAPRHRRHSGSRTTQRPRVTAAACRSPSVDDGTTADSAVRQRARRHALGAEVPRERARVFQLITAVRTELRRAGRLRALLQVFRGREWLRGGRADMWSMRRRHVGRRAACAVVPSVARSPWQRLPHTQLRSCCTQAPSATWRRQRSTSSLTTIIKTRSGDRRSGDLVVSAARSGCRH